MPDQDHPKELPADLQLADGREAMLKATFSPFMIEVKELIARASMVKVSWIEDTDAMGQAREIRLKLKKIRTSVEARRKDLKANVLREGKAIDGMANVLKYLIVPHEKELKEKEETAKRHLEEQQSKLLAQRSEELRAVGCNPSGFDLKTMEEHTYQELLNAMTAMHKAKMAAAPPEPPAAPAPAGGPPEPPAAVQHSPVEVLHSNESTEQLNQAASLYSNPITCPHCGGVFESPEGA